MARSWPVYGASAERAIATAARPTITMVAVMMMGQSAIRRPEEKGAGRDSGGEEGTY